MLYWTAIYNDGTELCQYNESGTENAYKDIDRTRLSEFRLNHENDGSLVFTLVLDENQRLIFRKRTTINTIGVHYSYYLVGWQKTINEENIQAISYIHESGSPVIMAGKFNEDSPLLYSVVPVEAEIDGVHNT